MIQQKWDENSFTTGILQVGDVVLSFATGALALFYHLHQIPSPRSYWIAILMGTLLIAYVFPKYHLYHFYSDRSWRFKGKNLVMAMATAFLLLVAVGFFTKTSAYFSRFWLFSWFVSDLIALILLRALWLEGVQTLKKFEKNQRKILIIGQSAVGQSLMERLKESLSEEFNVIHWMKNISREPGFLLKDFMADKKVDEIWLCLSPEQQGEVKDILSQLSESIVTIRYFPYISGVNLREEVIVDFLGFPMVNLIASPMVGINQLVKAVEDYVLASFIFILVSPLMLVAAILVKCSSPGDIIYRQLRHGWDGKKFYMYKFRSMYVHEEPTGQVVQASQHDSRVTKIGRWLRRTSLDEIPQLLNVLQGRMSLVGPRPHAVEHNELYKTLITAYMQRHQVKPGMTGWAQVNGWRGETDTLEKMKKRVEMDLYYIKHWSVWFDLKIIFLTIWKGFFHKNAY